MTVCHACSSEGSDRLVHTDEGQDVLRCRTCGFVYLASWEESLTRAMELYDYYARLSSHELVQRYSAENRARHAVLLERFGRLAGGRRLLDVGCGDGQLLISATGAGWDPFGIDLSHSAIDLCQRRGLRATQTDFFDCSLDQERFDVIVMSELIEHVPQPYRFFRRAEYLLRRDGVLYITTPNFGSLARRLLGRSWSVFHPEHIGYFERSTLRSMVKQTTALREIRIDANNIGPSTMLAWIWPSHHGGRRLSASPRAVHKAARRSVDQRLRSSLKHNRTLGLTRDVLNHALSRTGLGDTLVGWFQASG